MLREDRLPYCVTACPRKVLFMGDLNADLVSNGVESASLSRLLGEGDAFRYKEDLGTQPRVWYLPGHGQDFGRSADDTRPLLPPEWTWGGEGNDRKIGPWPWGEKP